MTRLSLLLLLLLALGSIEAQTPSKTKPAKASPTAKTKIGNWQGLPATDELYRTIAELDAKVFQAFNTCDLQAFGSYFTEELEFYHDNGGLTNKTRQSLVEALRNNICNKVNRHLVPGTLRVFPMHGYGALETGVHRFTHPGRDHIDPMGEAQFIHLWQKQPDGTWKITRVISYDHRAVEKK
jgi:ketosteroid isomerase-like protein